MVSGVSLRCWIARCGRSWCCSFFFQAEDGIRDLVRSRGLGDVYKRQLALKAGKSYDALVEERVLKPLGMKDTKIELTPDPVSYTHLTLPTSDLV